MVESKGEDHLFGYTVLGLLASRCPVGVRAQALVEIAAVVVDKIITSIDDLFSDKKGRTLSLRPISFPRVEAVHALVIDGVHMGDLLFEGLNVDEGDKDNGAGDLRGIKSVDEFFAMMDVYSVPWAPETRARTGPRFSPLMMMTGILVAASTPAGTSK